jgi:threonine/homoserine/homoserine lactone efflux protein
MPMEAPFLTLILASLVVMGSPGPSTISVTAVGAAYGLRRSLGYVTGLILGTATVLLAVATGVMSILLSVPRLAPLLLAASALYMLYLAFRIATAPPLSRSVAARAPSIGAGFLLAVANPKAYLAIAAVFAGTRLSADTTLDAVLKTAVLALMIVIIHVCWLAAGASFSRVFHDPVWSRVANIVFAAMLVVVTLLAFF